MRVAEIMVDFRNIQTSIAAIRVSPTAEEYNEEGFVVLRRCVADAQGLLSQPFQAQGGDARRDEEEDKILLQRIVTDASVRRFKAQKIYLQAMAAVRWVSSRLAILQGQRPHAGHAPALQQIENALRTELASITDERVELLLRSADATAGKWLVEDPSLATIQRLSGSGSDQG